MIAHHTLELYSMIRMDRNTFPASSDEQCSQSGGQGWISWLEEGCQQRHWGWVCPGVGPRDHTPSEQPPPRSKPHSSRNHCSRLSDQWGPQFLQLLLHPDLLHHLLLPLH